MKCLDGILFEYDMNGNLIRKTDPAEGITDYIFNYNNRLYKTIFPDNAESVSNYSSSGLRSMSRDKTGNTTHYYWDELNIESIPNAISESDDKGNITNTYLPGIGFRHINNNNNWRWFITDHLGSIIALTDDAGNVCDIYEYDEYEIQTTSKGTSFNPYRYIGQQFDEETGMIYLRARYYDSQTGRFLTRDPIGIRGGMNLYLYSQDNPIKNKDISGLYLTDFSAYPRCISLCYVSGLLIIAGATCGPIIIASHLSCEGVMFEMRIYLACMSARLAFGLGASAPILLERMKEFTPTILVACATLCCQMTKKPPYKYPKSPEDFISYLVPFF